VSDVDRYDPGPLLEALVDARVDFVLIGGLAGIAHGSSYPTYDLDIMYSREPANLERLARLLKQLGATLRGAPKDLPFILDARTLEEGGNFTFDTPYGAFDILAYPSGAPKFDELKNSAEEIEFAGRRVLVASLDHLIAMKDAAGRGKDRLMATEYRVLADEQRRQS
jgi:hypothetical protein